MTINKTFWKNKTILVTGGAGFIGSNLVEKLLELGAKVRVADNLSRGTLDNLSKHLTKIDFQKVDLTDPQTCIDVTRNIDYVFHLASSVGGIHYITHEKVENLTPSVTMTLNLLEASIKNKVQRFLFTSSACVYKGKEGIINVYKEEDAYPAQPNNTYGWAKILGEIACKSYYEDYGLKCSVVRIFNAYGENENLDPKWSHVIPSLIRKAILYPKEPFKIFGDGKQVRSFLYVKDCVEGLLLAMEKIENADPINLGSEEPITIFELAKKIIKLSGKEINIELDPKGTIGVHGYIADTTKMKKVLDWKPNTKLDDGLHRTFNWAKNKLKTIS
ncbi:MAG: SDR family NAD(P)-dependent oxidoreductase [Thermoprotei archaeon]